MSESDKKGTSTTRTGRRGWRRLPFVLVAALWAATLVGAIWAPYGFSMGGVLEEWDMRFLLNTGQIGWSAFPGQPMSHVFAARPLTPVTFALANFFDPTSFSGLHVLLLVACLTKVLAGTAIGWWLFRNKTLALVIGALTFVLPADTQQIALRNVHINIAVALLLVACLLSVRSLYKRTLRHRTICMAAAVALGLIGCGIYEPVFPLYVLPPLLIYARLGFVRAWRLILRRRSVVFLWLAGAATGGLYLFYTIAIRKTGYQVELAGGKTGGIFKSVIDNASALIDSAAYRILIDSWRAAWEIATSQTTHWLFFPATFLLVLAALAVATDWKSHWHYSVALATRSVVVGLLAVVAGYAPILVSASHVALTQRTFLAAAPGAALFIASVLALVSLVLPRVAAAIAALAISLGLIAQLYQHDAYVRAYSDIMHPYMKAVASRSDPSKSVHLVIDESGLGGYLGGVYVSKLMYGVTYMRSAYGDSYILCKSERLQESMPFSNCVLEGRSWVVSAVGEKAKPISASAVDVIEMPPFVADEAFAMTVAPFSPFLPSRGATQLYDCAADSMWGYNRFCPGEGWSDGLAYRAERRMLSRFDAVEPDPTLFFRLLPVDGPYVIRLLLAQPLPNAIADRWALEVNQSKVPMRAINATLYEGEVPAAFLKRGPNVIKFSGVLSEQPGGALSVRRISLARKGHELVSTGDMHARLASKVKYGTADETLQSALISGFSTPEPGGIWTDGGVAVIVFSTDGRDRPAVLEISAIPFLNEKHQSMEVDAWIDGVRTATFRFTFGAPSSKIRIPLPANLIGEGKPVELRLVIRNPASPSEIGAGERFLGLFVQEVKISD